MKYLTIFALMIFGCAKTEMLTENSKVEGLKMQPKEALALAAPYIDEHAVYLWRDSSKLRTHIVRKGKFYYIIKTDYPAKTMNYIFATCS
jgi:hypothetical protein